MGSKKRPFHNLGHEPVMVRRMPVQIPKTSDSVNHPSHYGGDTTYEVIKVAEAWGFDKDAYLFTVLKYIARAGKKDPGKYLEDLKKAAFYLNRRISNLEKEALLGKR